MGDAIAPEDTKAIENPAGYVVRGSIPLKRLVYLDGRQAVIYRGLSPSPRLGRKRSFRPLRGLRTTARPRRDARLVPLDGDRRELANTPCVADGP